MLSCGFRYAEGKMINQLVACKLEDNKVFHIHVELLDENTVIFIKQLLNPSAWEISNLEKWSTMRQLDICFNDLDIFIEMIHYCYENMADLLLVNTN